MKAAIARKSSLFHQISYLQNRNVFQVVGGQETQKLPHRIVSRFSAEKIIFMQEVVGLERQQLVDKLDAFQSLARIDVTEFKRSYQTFLDLGYTKEDIRANAELLGVRKERLLYRHAFLTELGAVRIPIQLLRTRLYYLTIRQAKSMLGINTSEMISERLLADYDLPNDSIAEVLKEEKSGSHFLNFTRKLHWTVLSHLLETSTSHGSAFCRYPTRLYLDDKFFSLRTTRELVGLMEKYKLKPDVTLVPVFRAHPDVMKEVLERYPTVGEEKTHDLMMYSAKFWSLSCEGVEAVKSVLDQFSFPVEVCEKNPETYLIPSEMLRHFLSSISPEELRFLKLSPDFVERFLPKKKGYNYSSPETDIAEQIMYRETRKRGTPEPPITAGSCWYLSAMLGLTPQELRSLFKRRRIPIRSVRFSQAEDIVRFLVDLGFRQQQIVSAIEIVTYPKSSLFRAVMELPLRPELQPFEKFKPRDELLHFLLYILERDSNFNCVEELDSKKRC